MMHHYLTLWVIVVFFITYAVVVSEKTHRTVAALAGALAILLSKVLTPEEAIHYIDFNTIGLLVGMMIIVGVTRQTGVFEFLAIRASKLGRGEPLRVMALLALLTAVLSALLDNVTTVLLIVPVTLAITSKLQVNPIPFIITEILASNIGGTATLIGDPPNIMIGGATHLGFVDFVINLTPLVLIVFPVTVFILLRIYRNSLSTTDQLRRKILTLNEKKEIKNPVLLKQSLFVLALTILGFALHQTVHLESSVVALGGATLLLLVSRFSPEHALETVEWSLIFFFIGLFIVVGSLEATGVIESIAHFALETTQGALLPTAIFIIWLSAIASSFVDNIPFVATMLPLINDVGRLGAIGNIDVLWWSLALGACLGGNGTTVGASANLVAIGMAERRNVNISFVEFFKVGFPLMILSIILATVYITAWYLLDKPGVILVSSAIGILLTMKLMEDNSEYELEKRYTTTGDTTR